jgi:hypothetical protein
VQLCALAAVSLAVPWTILVLTDAGGRSAHDDSEPQSHPIEKVAERFPTTISSFIEPLNQSLFDTVWRSDSDGLFSVRSASTARKRAVIVVNSERDPHQGSTRR